jgi:hypothetical protein
MASLVKAGFVLEAAEPDLIAKVGQQRLAIAAKRLRSGSKLERNLKDGAKQIKRQRLPGIVAIDISFIELINKPLYINKSEHQMVPAKVLLDGFAQENMSLILKICERYKCSVLLHLCCSTRSVKSSTLFVSRRWLLISNQFDPVCNHLITGFQQLKP